jgi:hypothetical protein
LSESPRAVEALLDSRADTLGDVVKTVLGKS